MAKSEHNTPAHYQLYPTEQCNRKNHDVDVAVLWLNSRALKPLSITQKQELR